MLRVGSKPAAALRKLLRSLKKYSRRLWDPTYFSQRDKFLDEAKQVLPWLKPQHLTLLAYKKAHTQLGMAGLPRHWEIYGEPEPDGSVAREQWNLLCLLRILDHQPRTVSYCVFRRGRKVEGRLYDLKKLNLFSPEPLWIERRIRKSDGKTWRVIHVPNAVLKQLHRFVLRRYLDGIAADRAAYGFRRGAGRYEHAKHHCGKQLVIRLDIRDFFPTVTIRRIIPIFQECGFCERMARLLANLVTYRGQLPQGAPTSPKLADLVARLLDRDLRVLASRTGWYYSRYADDLCFSTNRQLSRRDINSFIKQVSELVRSHGFRLNGRKTRVMRRHRRQLVAGLLVNGSVPAARREVRRKFRAVLHNLHKYGVLETARKHRKRVAESWVQRFPKAGPLEVRQGRKPWELKRSDRIWPYDKQIFFTPSSVRGAARSVEDSREETMVYDFWHFLCGITGELISAEPHKAGTYRDALVRCREAIAVGLRDPASDRAYALQSLIDEINRAVREVNIAAQHFEEELLEPFRMPPSLVRPASCKEEMLYFCGWMAEQWWAKARHKLEMRRAGVYPYTLSDVELLYGWLSDTQKSEKEDLVRQTLRKMIGVEAPDTGDWPKLQIALLERVREDLGRLRGWARRRPGPKGSIDPHDCDSLRKMISRGESQTVEFKSADAEPRDIVRAIAAFLNNRHGGWIVYGVTDEGMIAGAPESRDEFEQKVQNSMRDRIEPTPQRLEIREIKCEDKKVFVIAVPPWRGEPSHFRDDVKYRILVRAGTVVRDATPSEVRRLYNNQPTP